MGDIQTQLPIKITDGTNTVAVTAGSALTVAGTITNVPSGTQPVSGTITNVPSGTQTTAPTGTQTVAGTVTNVPSGTQTVAGTVTNVPSGTQTVAGSVTITGTSTVTTVPSGTQPVSGTITNVPSGTQPVSGTVTAISTPGEITTGLVLNYALGTTIASASTGTLSYTVTAGKTLYIKGVFASSSGAPCKVVVDTGTSSPTVLAVGFYSSANPFLAMEFFQPAAVAATTVVNIKIQNNSGQIQDVYGTLLGHEI